MAKIIQSAKKTAASLKDKAKRLLKAATPGGKSKPAPKVKTPTKSKAPAKPKPAPKAKPAAKAKPAPKAKASAGKTKSTATKPKTAGKTPPPAKGKKPVAASPKKALASAGKRKADPKPKAKADPKLKAAPKAKAEAKAKPAQKKKAVSPLKNEKDSKSTAKKPPAKAKSTPASARANPAPSSVRANPKAALNGNVKARRAEDARNTGEKEAKGAKIPAAVKNAIKSKGAGAKKPSKPRVVRPIAFTLDEALEIAKVKPKPAAGESGAAEAGSEETGAPRTAAARKKDATNLEVKQENRVLGAASVADILGYNPKAGPKKPIEEEEIPAKFTRYYKLLVELRDHVVSGLNLHTQDTLKRSAKEDSGNLSAYSQHMADAGTDTFDRDFALSLVSSEQEALYEIEDAIKRIRNGTYGVCEITGKPIKKERLMAVPFTRFSVEGQVEFERTNRRSTQRGGVFSETDEAVQFLEDDVEE